MANRSARDDIYAPCLFRNFTSFTSQILLESTDAPANAQQLPCELLVQVHTAAQHLDVKDAGGTKTVITFEAVGNFRLRMAPVSIETTTNVPGVTVFWQPCARV